jgi:hypothetical protein
MSIVKSLEAAVNTNYVFLRVTREITQFDIDNDPAWNMVYKEYDQNKDGTWLSKACASVINSIICQRRLVFIMNRNHIRNMLQNDKNWKPEIGLKNENYSALIKMMCSGLVEKKEEVLIKKTGRYVVLYKVVHPEVLKFLKCDEDEQTDEARNSLNKGEVVAPPKSKEERMVEAKIWSMAITNYQDQWAEATSLENSSKKNDQKKAIDLKKELYDKAYIEYNKKEER